ncbi:MAG: hypothetical protein B6244_04730 [Candidatus Cloacimonetes bacterium 4572_55]|nr:MAG: hypothetical protein B6244_04730 [Candidatus Cloacimonetes bacterium 4572_55]
MRFSIIIIALFFTIAPARAQDVIFSMSQEEGQADEQVDIDLSVSNSLDLSGFSARIYYDSDLLSVDHISATERLAGFASVMFNYNTPGVIHCLVVDLGENCLDAEEGAVAVCSFNIIADPGIDTVSIVSLDQMAATHCDDPGIVVTIDHTDGSIHIMPRIAIIFDQITASYREPNVLLEWELNETDRVVGCRVYRYEFDEEWYQLTNSLLIGPRAYHYEDQSVLPDRDYRYRIAAVGSLGEEKAQQIIAVETVRQKESPEILPVAPNPSTGLFSIHFRLTNPSPVSIRLFSVSGQQIADIFDQEMGEGEHVVSWDGRKIPSGAYLIAIKTSPDSYHTQRLIMVK